MLPARSRERQYPEACSASVKVRAYAAVILLAGRLVQRFQNDYRPIGARDHGFGDRHQFILLIEDP